MSQVHARLLVISLCFAMVVHIIFPASISGSSETNSPYDQNLVCSKLCQQQALSLAPTTFHSPLKRIFYINTPLLEFFNRQGEPLDRTSSQRVILASLLMASMLMGEGLGAYPLVNGVPK